MLEPFPDLRDLVAQEGCTLELQRIGRLEHFAVQFGEGLLHILSFGRHRRAAMQGGADY